MSIKLKGHSAPAKSPTLVFACAWCSSETFPPLKEGEIYTHGICTLHKLQLLFQAKQARSMM
ncbi:hypothetical protein A2688_04060 [Candidatus Daviesbacteria bacterium RIFCSPHIGHO2_01_FULL_38_8]|nr:MAG: hypothetical protein A2688_04060 [Candidatus Daviesbacteria bacterium RIFCSPHIGHO2_01_FULL_38_8]